MSHAFVLLAAGSGQRMLGVVEDKTLVPVAGRPVLEWSARAFLASGLPGRFLVVCRDERQRLRLEPLLRPLLGDRLAWVHGGRERQHSVAHALARLGEETELVFIHDCARPLVRPEQLRQLAERARRDGSAVLAHRIRDTVKETVEDAAVEFPLRLQTLDRRRLWATETPQVFRREWITAAYGAARHAGAVFTDDAAAIEAAGHPVSLVENPHPNPKLTTPQDLAYIEFLLAPPPPA